LQGGTTNQLWNIQTNFKKL